VDLLTCAEVDAVKSDEVRAGEEGTGLDVSEGAAPHPTGGGDTPAVAGEGVVDALVLT